MTKGEKELLLKDLCARLPYNTTKVRWYKYRRDPEGYEDKVLSQLLLDTDKGEVYCKPYLRPMSSMTKEEYNSVCWDKCSHVIKYSLRTGFNFVSICSFTIEILNFLISHHFDFIGLIDKGLALPAPEGMYKL